MSVLFHEPFYAPPSDAGATLPGAKLNSYKTGTTTRQNTYTDSGLTVAHANPVIADANGRFAPIYLDDTLDDYKFVLTDANDVEIDTVDPYLAASLGDLSVENKSANYTITAADNNKIINVTASATISLGDASTLGARHRITIKNSHTDAITISRDTGADTIDAVAADFILGPGAVLKFTVNAAADGYLISSSALSSIGTVQNSTSGTSIDFTDIPAWVTKIDVNFYGVSTDGTDPKLIQIGDSGGIETSGYTNEAYSINDSGPAITAVSTAVGFAINSVAAVDQLFGTATLTLMERSNNTWLLTTMIWATGTPRMLITSGGKQLSGTLDRVRVTTSGGTDNFDAGTVNIRFS